MADTDPISLNVTGVQDLVESPINKTSSGVLSRDEGVRDEHEDALTLGLDDEELLALRNQWESKYAGYEAGISKRQRANKAYYLGKQAEGTYVSTDDKPIASNLLFEAEETFLPAALSKNPEPVVYADNTDEGNKIADDVKTMLQYHADQLVLRRKLAHMTRQWSLNFLGVLKHGWDKDIKDITTQNRKIQDFVFDPDGTVDAYGDFDSYLGERITVTAGKLCELFPDERTYITVMVDGKLGTDAVYTEWWTDEFCFVTFKDKVLDKHKNEFFKYDREVKDEFGLPMMERQRNHFARPKKPYTFLSVFNLGEHPHDDTGLIEQNIPNQNLVTKRTYQIDRNLSRNNNSVAFSENNFNQETAKQAATAFEKGNPVLVPSGGPIAEAIVRFPAEGFPDAAFKELEQNKFALRQIFGTQGITAQQPDDDQTARGMILNQQYDNTRIGGGIGDALGQVADNVFNWWVQLYYVYYDVPHFGAIMGQMKATEYVTLSSQNLDRQLIVSVAPDSMKPKDELTTMNQAMQLYEAGALDPKTLLTILNVPDPEGTAESTVLWLIDKQAYLQLNFPEVAQQLQQYQQQQMAQQQQLQQQQVAQQGEAANAQLSQKDEAHKQQMSHKEQAHQQKMAQSSVPTTGGAPESSALNQVKLPK